MQIVCINCFMLLRSSVYIKHNQYTSIFILSGEWLISRSAAALGYISVYKYPHDIYENMATSNVWYPMANAL